jgi:hypothetical protein
MNFQEKLLLRSWQLYRRSGLRSVAHTVIGHVPIARRWVDKAKDELSVLNRRLCTPPKELQEHYTDMLRLLINRRGAANVGDYLEFGVFNGTSMICMYRALTALKLDHVRLFGFDSFEGLPPDEEGHWGHGGRFSCDLDTVKRILRHEGVDLDRITFVKGFYRDTLTIDLLDRHGLKNAGIVMVDCDLYRSTVECLSFADQLISESIVCFDDWYPLSEKNMGEKRAFDEFLAARLDCRATEIPSYCNAARTFLVENAASQVRVRSKAWRSTMVILTKLLAA